MGEAAGERRVSDKPIPRRLRFEILRRDGYTCRYCGAQAPDVPLTVDHVIPRALGGSDDPTNLITACHDCNAGKGSTSPDEHIVADVDAAALLFARATEKAAAIRRAQITDLDQLLTEFDQAWCRWTFTYKDETYTMPRKPDWRETIERFLASGLTIADLRRNADIAMRAEPRDEWRYFCGICWREISDIQEMARRLIEDGSV
jgi:HNH endonuclease